MSGLKPPPPKIAPPSKTSAVRGPPSRATIMQQVAAKQQTVAKPTQPVTASTTVLANADSSVAVAPSTGDVHIALSGEQALVLFEALALFNDERQTAREIVGDAATKQALYDLELQLEKALPVVLHPQYAEKLAAAKVTIKNAATPSGPTKEKK